MAVAIATAVFVQVDEKNVIIDTFYFQVHYVGLQRLMNKQNVEL